MKTEKQLLGKRTRAAGMRFELKVRVDLEQRGFIVAKWTNNVDLETKQVVKAKAAFNPYSRALSLSTGFPDFIAINRIGNIGLRFIESKMSGKLDKNEKAKIEVIKALGFKCFLAKPDEEGGIAYEFL